MSALAHNVALVSESTSINFSDVSSVAGALQKQAIRDFAPIWRVNPTVSAFDKLESVPVDYWPVIVADNISEPGAAGYHTDDNGQPFALVQADDSWPLTASHETLEMLADPFGNRTLAGSPPPQAPAPISNLKRVTYLVEVCDPCEDNRFGYGVNGQQLSDFITPHYYDPNGSTGAQYSFRGNIKQPHDVEEGGYVSFGNPVGDHWYQIIVENGQMHVRDLGVIKTSQGKSLRELVDLAVRQIRKNEHYRTKAPVTAEAAMAAAASGGAPLAESNAARAKMLREYVKALK